MAESTKQKALKAMLGDYKRARVSKMLPEDQRPALTITIGSEPVVAPTDAEDDDEAEE